MSPGHVYSDSIHLKASAFDGFSVKAAIDFGFSFTKIIFQPEDVAISNPDFLPMRCLTYYNEHLKEALQTMKEHAVLPVSGQLHVTGLRDDHQEQMIKDILGLDVTNIDSNKIRGRGLFQLINATDSDSADIFHPEYNHKGVMMDFFAGAMKTLKDALPTEDVVFPALMINMGSNGEITYISKEGTSHFIRDISFNGIAIIGLANIMLGTNNYETIMEMASKGNRSKMDLLIKDITSENTTLFENLPPDEPLFPFAKCSDPTWTDDQCNKNDIAQSIITLLPAFLETYLFGLIYQFKVNRIYVTGNYFRSEISRHMFSQKLAKLPNSLDVKFKFLKTGHTKAIAAMLTNKGDENHFTTNNKSDIIDDMFF